jgi:hypothetical protein
MTKDANNPKTPEEMYNELAGIEEGGSLYTLKRKEPFHIEYIEKVSRTSERDPEASHNTLLVYLSTKRGKEYRIHIDCNEEQCRMEHNPANGWETYSTALSGFRYRSPAHPEHDEQWDHQME